MLGGGPTNYIVTPNLSEVELGCDNFIVLLLKKKNGNYGKLVNLEYIA